jgi:hypothetical protein
MIWLPWILSVKGELNMSLQALRWAVMVCLVGALIPAALAQDNSSVTGQLTAVKPMVAKVKKDAVILESYAGASGLNWSTHVAALQRMGTDINTLQESMRGLQSHRTTASPWQQAAIDQITGLTNDLADNMNNAIAQVSKSKSRPTAAPYPEYLKTNTQTATELSAAIDATIDYAETKAKQDELQAKLPQ